MTYCVAMYLTDDLMFASDSWTNAGIDHIAIFRKLFIFDAPGECLLVVRMAGNLATSRLVINLLQQRIRRDGASPSNVPSVYDVTALITETTHEVTARDGDNPAGNTDLSYSFLTGGQIVDRSPALRSTHFQGNSIQAMPDMPFLQLGEGKYDKPILDHDLTFDMLLERALRCALVSFDSTTRSSLSVGMPLDLLVYHRDSLILLEGYRIAEDDAYLSTIRRRWSAGLHDLLGYLLSPPPAYNI